jgi:hypothetical protein
MAAVPEVPFVASLSKRTQSTRPRSTATSG